MNLAPHTGTSAPQIHDVHPAIVEAKSPAPYQSSEGEQPKWWLWPFQDDHKHAIVRIEFNPPQHA